ncbi:MAG TPA: SDR family oxidoreductase [Armatimonadetes bacterium]|nr:SDR family oxidoreductase [Armatimonadota bacterium]
MGEIYLVTGGAGFIGSHIVERLVRLGKKVRVVDNLSTGRLENIAHLLDEIEFIEGDICDPDLVREAMEGVEFVLHQAAIPSVPRSVENPLSTHEANVTGTVNVLVAAKEAGVKRVVYASSSSVYGDQPELPKRENQPPAPKSPYAASKLAGEYYCLAFCHVYGLDVVCLRYFNVFGPRQDPDSPYAAVVPKFISAFIKGEPPTIHGDGEQTRDFTFVQNVVDANLLALKAEGAKGEVFNIASGKAVSVNRLARLIRELIGAVEVEPTYGPPRPGDIRHSWADISKAERILGYKPRWSLKEGLKATINWHRERLEGGAKEG